MSKVFNMVGGGGGKNISSIIISGLSSTDTVTCTKDGKSYTATWDDTAQHWEIVGLPLGTFTVTATRDSKTTTETVLIDITGVYEVEMTFKLWLYREGDEFEDTTGGWERLTSGYTFLNASFAQNGSDNTFSKEEYNMHLTSYYVYSTLVATANSFDLSNYTKLHIESSGYENLPICPIVSVSDSTSLTIEYHCELTTENEYQYTEIDISDISIQSKIFLIAYSGAKCHVRKVWLEM